MTGEARVDRRAELLPVEEDALQVTVKLDVPLLSVRPEVVSSCAERVAMSIAAACQAESSMGPVVPLIVAEAPLKLTVPKLARGRTPLLDDGASTTHSADDPAPWRRSGTSRSSWSWSSR